MATIDPNDKPTWRAVFSGQLLLPTLVINWGILLFAIDTFIITTIMPSVIEDIGGTSLYAWPVMIFTVGAIVGAASAGPIRIKYGQRDGFVLAGSLFLFGNLGAAFASTIEILIAWRLLQGLGGGLIISQAFGVVGSIYPPGLRTRIFSVISTTWGLATVFGPAFGGIFAELGSWRSAFWALVPLTLIFCILVWKFIGNTGKGEGAQRFPVTRLILFSAGILTIGFTSQTDESMIRILLILTAICLVAWAMRRDALSKNRMFPRKTLVPTSAIGSSYWYNLFFTCMFIFALLYSTLYLQILHDKSPIIAAYISASLSFCWTAAALICASWRGVMIRVAVVGGGLLMVAGAIGLYFFAVEGPIGFIVVSFGLMGLGIGFSNIHVMALTIECAERGDDALVASSIQTIRNMGLAFGSAFAGLLANSAGLKEEASPLIISRAVELIHTGAIILAILTLLSLIIFIGYHHKENRFIRNQ
ncbi:MAG: MFS transporter [Rhodospirillales bacterium]|nr:MFS transporter [Rhodospirillales bacterium]